METIRVLVVDDEADLAEAMAHILQEEGYQPTVVTDPRKALASLAEADFHLILLDMRMPGLSGPELLAHIREVDSDIAIVVATAFPDIDSAIASLRHHVSDYLRKPFEPEELLATVRSVLEEKGLTLDPEIELHRELGRAFREARLALDLTLKQVARRTGLSVSLLSQIERAESAPSIGSLYRIARALGLRLATLFAKY